MISERAVYTATPLGIAGVWTSPKFPIDDVSCIVVSCYANQNGTLVVQQSHDGTNFDISESHAYTAAAKTQIEVNVAGLWGQLVYTNGAAAQATFRCSAAKKKSFSSVAGSVSAVAADLTSLLADVGDASGSTLGSLYAILGNPGTSIAAQLAAIAAYIDTEVASILAAVDTEVAAILADTDSIDGATGILHEQADAAVNVNAISASETTIFDLSTASTRYLVRHLRLKAADPGADTITVRLYELVNDVLTVVDTFAITTANYATYHSLMDMFGVPHLAGDSLKVTVQTDANTYAVTGQYSHAKTNN